MIQAINLAQRQAYQPQMRKQSLREQTDKSNVSFKDCPNWRIGRGIGVGACAIGLVLDVVGISGLSHIHLPIQDGHEVFNAMLATIGGLACTFGGAWLAIREHLGKGHTDYGV